VFDCCRGFSGGGACVTHDISGGVFFRCQLLFWVFSLYLIVCFVLDLAWLLLFSTDCL
jgi:hypothetical protein